MDVGRIGPALRRPTYPSDDRRQFSTFNSECSGLAHYGTPGDTTSSVGFRKTDNAW